MDRAHTALDDQLGEIKERSEVRQVGYQIKEMKLKYCEIQWTDYGCVTYFQDGSEASAWPHWTNSHYTVISHRTGYGDDLLTYTQEHDLCHCLIEEALHDRPSRVLWALAHNQELTGPESAYEEFAAQALQRWLRANERPILSGVDWDALKDRALNLIAKASQPNRLTLVKG